MSTRSTLSALRRGTINSLYTRTVPWGDRGPVVSFTFDDFPRSAYVVGGSILKGLGACGTYYTAPGLMGTENELGEQFLAEDVRALLRDGHELGCHTFSHISGRAVRASAYRKDVERGRKAMAEIAGVQDSGNFAYPYGHATVMTKKSVGPRMTSSRGIFPGLNGPDVDLNLLRGNNLYGDRDQFNRTHDLILENEKQKNWLIVYTHDVCPRPSLWGCTPSLLEAAAAFALQRGCRILTVQQVLTELGVRGV